MKRFVTLALVVAFAIAFIGCKATITGPTNDDRGGPVIHKGIQPPHLPILLDEKGPIGF